MSTAYKIRNQEALYFVTFTVVDWIDVFTRNEYRDVIVESIQFCQKEKGLEVYAWTIMTNHVHLIVGSQGEMPLEGIIRDLKSFTSRSIRKTLESKEAVTESRRSWILWKLKAAGIRNKNNKDFQLWQQHNHPIEIASPEMLYQKLEYIHMNPVKAGFVDRAEAWLYSSASDYMENKKGMIELCYV